MVRAGRHYPQDCVSWRGRQRQPDLNLRRESRVQDRNCDCTATLQPYNPAILLPCNLAAVIQCRWMRGGGSAPATHEPRVLMVSGNPHVRSCASALLYNLACSMDERTRDERWGSRPTFPTLSSARSRDSKHRAYHRHFFGRSGRCNHFLPPLSFRPASMLRAPRQRLCQSHFQCHLPMHGNESADSLSNQSVIVS